MQDFRKLRAWRAAHALTLTIYRVTSHFPQSERYGIVAQLRDAAASIGANIAEGCGRSTNADMRRCVYLAFSSACEVLNHVILARDLGYVDASTFAALESRMMSVRRMLIHLIDTLGPPRNPQHP